MILLLAFLLAFSDECFFHWKIGPDVILGVESLVVIGLVRILYLAFIHFLPLAIIIGPVYSC